MKLLPDYMITLSFGKYDAGLSVVLDANEGKCHLHLSSAMCDICLGRIREWFQDDDILDDHGVDACKYFEKLLQRYRSLEQIPVNQEILSEDDDTMVRLSPHYLQTSRLTFVDGNEVPEVQANAARLWLA